METRKEAEAQFDAAGIDLAGKEYHEIPDPNGDGVTRVWCRPGSMLASIMEEVVASSAKQKADDKHQADLIRREIAGGKRPAEDEQFADCIEQGAYFDYDSLTGHSGHGGEMQFRCKRFALAIEAIHVLQEANVWFDDEGYPGWEQIDKALSALREFRDLPEYDEWSGNSASASIPF